ncbi:MAG: T9SS type A sorting domain-containing protein [Candidatus Kapabacteria bacterium]|nr:T9SS type A sorting domain-containing protein [Candidatus Kapabacteria bacterium]
MTIKHFTIPIAICLCITGAMAQPFSNPIPYTIPLGDSIRTTDMTDFPAIPITDVLRLRVSGDGHFTTQSGKRVRIFGATISYFACLPDSADAVDMTRRLRQLGYNAVRLIGWDITAPGYTGLIDGNASTTDTAFNTLNIKKLDWLIAQCKANGLYVFLVNNAYRPHRNDGVPDWDSIADYWNVRSLQYTSTAYQIAQRKFLKRLFEHVNPYTGNAYKVEPAIASLQASNDTYLSLSFQNGQYNTLTPRQIQNLDSLYQMFLLARYKNDDGLKAAWASTVVNPTNLLRDPGFESVFSSPWILNVSSGSEALLNFSEAPADKVEGTQAARIRVNKAGGNWYDLQLIQRPISLVRGRQYRLTFHAKTTAQQGKRPFLVTLIRPEPPYSTYGLALYDTLTSTMKQYSYLFVASATHDDAAIMFGLGQSLGDVYLDNASLKEEASDPLRAGESLTKFNIKFTDFNNNDGSTYKRWQESGLFVAWLTERYHSTLRSYLKDTLKCLQLVSGTTRTEYLHDMVSNFNMDFTSSGSYISGFSGSNSADKSWNMQNQSFIEQPYPYALYLISKGKIKGKPHVISNSGIAYPNRFVNEIMTYVPYMAAYQDWDGMFINDVFDYTQIRNQNLPKDNFWSTQNLVSMQSLAPFAATMFRSGVIPRCEEVIALNHSADLLTIPAWQQQFGYNLFEPADPRMPLFRRIEIDSINAKLPSFLPQLLIPQFTDPNGLDMANIKGEKEQFHLNQVSGWMKFNTPQFVGVQGQVKQGLFEFDNGITIEHRDANSMGTFLWQSNDTNAITHAKKSLFVISSRTQNKGAVWSSGDSVSIWRNWGSGSTEVEGLAFRISMRSTFDSLFVYPLDSLGRRTGERIVAKKTGSRFGFDIDQAKTKSLWYAVEQSNIPTSVLNETGVEGISIYPQPAHDYIIVDMPSLQNELTVARILDLRGIQMKESVLSHGNRTLDVRSLPAGMYVVTFRTGTDVIAKRFVIER